MNITTSAEFFALFTVADDAGLASALVARFNAAPEVSVRADAGVVEINDVAVAPHRRSLSFALPRDRAFIVEKLADALGTSIEAVDGRIADANLTGPF